MILSSNIARLLLKVGAVLLRPNQPFTWASGIQSPIYCDNRLLLSDPKARGEVIRSFVTLIKKKKIKCDAIAGIATAGIPHAAILADRLKKPLLYVRASPKEHGKGNQIEGKLKKGSRVLVVEDLISTGGSSLAAVEALRQAGAKVSDCLAIFSYEFPESEKAFDQAKCCLETLTNLKVLLDVAQYSKIISLPERDLIKAFAKNPRQWNR